MNLKQSYAHLGPGNNLKYLIKDISFSNNTMTITRANIKINATSGAEEEDTENLSLPIVTSATQLQNTRKIWGNSFNGTQDVKGDIIWEDGNVRQKIHIVDDATSGTSVFEFQQSTDQGANYGTLFTIKDDGTAESSGLVVNGQGVFKNTDVDNILKIVRNSANTAAAIAYYTVNSSNAEVLLGTIGIAGSGSSAMKANKPFWNDGSTYYQLVHSTAKTAVGGTSTPVYIDSNGRVQTCTSYSNASVATAATASNLTDGSTQTRKGLLYQSGASTTSATGLPGASLTRYLRVLTNASGVPTFEWVAAGTIAGSLSQLKFSKTPITGNNASKDVTFYRPDAEKTISYDTILPELGVKFLEANFFKLTDLGTSAPFNLFTTTNGYINPYFALTTVNAAGADEKQADWITNTTANPSDYGYIINGYDTATVTIPSTAWTYNSSNKRYYKGTGNSNTTAGIYCTLPSTTAKTVKITKSATINVKYGGATKSFNVSISFIRPVYIFSYSGIPDATFLQNYLVGKNTTSGTNSGTISTGTFRYPNEQGQVVTYRVILSLPSNTPTRIKIDDTTQQRVWILIPYNGSSYEIQFNNLKDGMGNNALDATYGGTERYITSETYGKYRLYASGTQACGLTPNMFINKS